MEILSSLSNYNDQYSFHLSIMFYEPHEYTVSS